MYNTLLTNHWYLADTINDQPEIHTNYSELLELATVQMAENCSERVTLPSKQGRRPLKSFRNMKRS